MASSLILSPTIPQARVLRSDARFKVLNAGRRFGKTHLAIDFYSFPRAVAIPNSLNWYIAPTYRAAKDIAWAELKRVVPQSYIIHKDETDLSIVIRNNATIGLKGADDPDSLRGPGLDTAVFDEAAFQKRAVWEVVRPMLSDRLGSALFISTPHGYNWFYDLYMSAKSKRNWEAFQFTTLDGGNVAPEEIEEARADLDPRMFRQEYEASFETLSGRVYYAFDRNENIKQLDDNTALPLLVGMDFNVNPMSAAIAIKQGAQLHFINEIIIPNGNTELMAKTIRAKYGQNRIIRVYPDPTGNSRKTSAPVGQTDFTILRQAGFSVFAPSSPYPVADKINTVNAGLLNAAGARRIFIDARSCPQLVKGWDGLTYKEGTSEPDKSLGLDHITDAAGYLTLWEMPMRGWSGAINLGGLS